MKDLKLIADCGSTLCDWIISNQENVVFETKGINPYYQTEEDIAAIVSELVSDLNIDLIGSVHFYGAGCYFPQEKELVGKVLSRYIPEAGIEVESDLLAAARALCGKESGIACILGTGSNSCFYNGSVIEKNVSPLGYILGDEGSGAVIGRIFIGNLLKNQYSNHLYESFMNYYNTSPQEIMETVYKQAFPNRYLAQFTKFIAENIKETEMYDLVFKSFSDFINKNIKQYDYQSYPVYFMGSVAFYFEDILKDACLTNEVWPAGIIQSPLNKLLAFHRENASFYGQLNQM